MRKVVSVCFAVTIVLLGVFVVAAVGMNQHTAKPQATSETLVLNPTLNIPANQAEAYIQQQLAAKAEQQQQTERHEEKTPGEFDRMSYLFASEAAVECFKAADKETQDQVTVFSWPYGGHYYEYPRQTMVITGHISEQAPRITLEQAEELIQRVRSEKIEMVACGYYVANEMRMIAEVDYESGSGFVVSRFCLNDAMDQYIDVYDGAVYYADKQNDVRVKMCSLLEMDEFVSILELMERGEIPPLRTD